MTTKLTEKNISSVANAGINWQSVIVADGSTGTTGVAGRGYFINTTSAAHTFTLPATATFADTILIKDYAGTFGTNKLTIARNGHNIQGVANNSLIGTNRASVVLVYVDVTRGWEYVTESNVADLQQALFTSATGGTITTSGDYKIHSFTGDGCFSVSTLGNGPTVPTGGPNTVSYLVVAGGGHGAGGFREGRDITPSYTASPIVAPAGLTIASTTYPITVGAGSLVSVIGSNSVFSTITSTGGGARGSGPGGSGGGCNSGGGGGSGNTPPVSPPQGNNGGPSVNGQGDSGGGGATAVGSPNIGPNNPGGRGGAGATTSISGSPTAYAGGGGGGANAGIGLNGSAASPCGTGGRGHGANQSGQSGTANTGGGGGTFNPVEQSGGKGIVIIRYKFQ